MTVNQISIFLENKPESLSQLTDVLAKNNINMRALSLADTSDFGIARIITDDCAAGFVRNFNSNYAGCFYNVVISF